MNSYFGGVTAEVVEKLFELAPLLLVVPRKTNHILPESMEGKVENRGISIDLKEKINRRKLK